MRVQRTTELLEEDRRAELDDLVSGTVFTVVVDAVVGYLNDDMDVGREAVFPPC